MEDLIRASALLTSEDEPDEDLDEKDPSEEVFKDGDEEEDGNYSSWEN